MEIMLGNLNVSEIEARLGINFPKDIIEFMEQNHQASARNISIGKWHCFDIPFHLVCGDVETAKKIFNALKDQASLCKVSLQISVYEKKEPKADTEG